MGINSNVISLDQKLRKANGDRAVAISYLGIFFFFALLILDVYRWRDGIIQDNTNYKVLAIIHLSFVLYFLPLLNRKFKLFQFELSRFPLDTTALLTILVVHITIIPLAIMGTHTRGEMISFAIFICVINLIFETDLRYKLLTNVSILGIMIVSLFFSDLIFRDRLVRVIEILGIMCPSYMLAVYQLRNRIKSHENEELLFEKNRELVEMNQIIKEKNEELKAFAYASSHDLKAPLRTIGNFTQLLQRKLNGKLDDSTIELMGFINGGVKDMSQMLDDLLDYATIERSDDLVHDTDMNEIFNSILCNLIHNISDNAAEINVQEHLPTLNMPRSIAIQLFQNLISNAIKFRKKEINPIINVNYHLKEGQHLISIEDNGIGIAKEYQQNVFGIFNRLHDNQTYEGHGIGLAACKKIVEKMEGHIWVESELGKGSVFHVSLPVEAALPSSSNPMLQ